MKKSQFFLVGSAVAALLLSAAPALARTAPAARFTYEYDVGLVDFTLWDTVFVGDTYTFNKVDVANYSVVPAYVWFEFRLPGYTGGKLLVLPVGDTQTVFLPLEPTVFESAGVYFVICCTLEWSLDQNPTNDGGTKYVVVLPRPGIEDAGPACGMPRRPSASLETGLNRAGGVNVWWYTATGRRIRPAAARPGVYFDVQGKVVRRVVLVR
jgi:hypothetical protein